MRRSTIGDFEDRMSWKNGKETEGCLLFSILYIPQPLSSILVLQYSYYCYPLLYQSILYYNFQELTLHTVQPHSPPVDLDSAISYDPRVIHHPKLETRSQTTDKFGRHIS